MTAQPRMHGAHWHHGPRPRLCRDEACAEYRWPVTARRERTGPLSLAALRGAVRSS